MFEINQFSCPRGVPTFKWQAAQRLTRLASVVQSLCSGIFFAFCLATRWRWRVALGGIALTLAVAFPSSVVMAAPLTPGNLV